MKYPPRAVSTEGARMMLKAARSQRTKALVVLLWRAGLRNSEACNLHTADLDYSVGSGIQVHIRDGKGGKARYVGLHDAAWAYLKPMMLQSAGPLLRTRSGGKLHPSSVRRTISLLGRAAGIGHRVHPHALRHTFARELHDEGIGMRVLQVALGHSSLATTERYLVSIGADEAVAITASREW